MKKILMLLQSEFPPDIRLEKEIRSLNEAGYKVSLLCNQYEKDLSPQFVYCKIIRIKAFFQNKKLNKILNFPFFLNPRFILYSFKAYFITKPDYIHAHDLPIVPLALILKFLFRKKVIFDMHENYPQALREFKKQGMLNFGKRERTLLKFDEDLKKLSIFFPFRSKKSVLLIVTGGHNATLSITSVFCSISGR